MPTGTVEADGPLDDKKLVYQTKEAREEAAALPNFERQRRIATMLIRYKGFKSIQADVERFHRPVTNGTHGCGEIGGLLGLARAGKSTAINDYSHKLGNVTTDSAEVPIVLGVNARKTWTSRDLGFALATKLLPGFSARGSIDVMFNAVVAEVVEYGIELVVIDDAQYLLTSTLNKTVRDTLGLALMLADTKRCNVLFAGTPEIETVVRGNPHVLGRGSFPHWTVSPYDWRDEFGRKAFTYLLDDIDDRLPFRRPSDLADPDLAAHFYRVSGGLIGLVLNYVRPAAYLAINEKADCITRAHLMRAAANRRTVDDRYQPFDGRLSLEETCVLPAEYGEDGDEEPAPVPHLNKKRTRSGIL